MKKPIFDPNQPELDGTQTQSASSKTQVLYAPDPHLCSTDLPVPRLLHDSLGWQAIEAALTAGNGQVITAAKHLVQTFHARKDVIQGIQRNPDGKPRTRARGYLPLFCTLEVNQGRCSISWFVEHHIADRAAPAATRRRARRRIPKSESLETSLASLSLALNRPDPAGSASKLARTSRTNRAGLTDQDLAAFHALVLTTERQAHAIRRYWSALKRLEKQLQSCRYHAQKFASVELAQDDLPIL